MALRAGHADMGSRKGELGRGVVIKLSPPPLHSCVASVAGSRKTSRHVIRTRSLVEVLQMAADTTTGSGRKLSVQMARGASHGGMGPGERELGQRIVIEFCALPVRGGMASIALHRKIEVAVIGVGGLFKVGQVTAGAIQGSSGKAPGDMASRALHADVGAGQGEFSRIVIEGHAQPGGGSMTSAAVVRKPGGHMIRILCGGESLRVTAEALG